MELKRKQEEEERKKREEEERRIQVGVVSLLLQASSRQKTSVGLCLFYRSSFLEVVSWMDLYFCVQYKGAK